MKLGQYRKLVSNAIKDGQLAEVGVQSQCFKRVIDNVLQQLVDEKVAKAKAAKATEKAKQKAKEKAKRKRIRRIESSDSDVSCVFVLAKVSLSYSKQGSVPDKRSAMVHSYVSPLINPLRCFAFNI